MATYRVLAEATQIYEVEVDADSESEALRITRDLDIDAFKLWDTTGMTDGFDIISVEEVAE